MIEKISRVNNPLTVIAIFAGLAEVAGSVALAVVAPSVQETFVWFIMLFPVALVILFFATLNFNPRVLYAPSDFKDEENFLSALAGRQKVEKQFDSVLKQLESSQEKLIENVVQEAGKGVDAQAELKQAIEAQLSKIREKLAETRQTADEYVFASAFPQSGLQSRITQYIGRRSEDVRLSELIAETDMSKQAVVKAVDRLVERGLLERVGTGSATRYRALNQANEPPNKSDASDA